ncbi:MAG: four helix bundle protein [Bdellovibrionota bacterium]
MKTFTTLELAIEFCELASRLEGTGYLKDQLNRASSSISLNLSEGNAKGTAKDKRRYFQTAYGSLRECQTIFRLLKVDDLNLLKKADHLGASLYKLINSNIKDSPNWKKNLISDFRYQIRYLISDIPISDIRMAPSGA